MESNPFVQINFFDTIYEVLKSIIFGVEEIDKETIFDDPTSAGFEKLKFENARPIAKHYLDDYELTIIEDRILLEIELKLNPFIKKS